MINKTKPIPEGFHNATPFLIVRDATSAIEFWKKAFGARELVRLADPRGKVRHAQIKIGDSPIMIGEHVEIDGPRPHSLPPVSIHLYVEDVDVMFRQAIAAGAKELSPVRDQYYGDREGGVEDPFGIVWWIATHKENLSPEEMQKRAAAASDRN